MAFRFQNKANSGVGFGLFVGSFLFGWVGFFSFFFLSHFDLEKKTLLPQNSKFS